MTTPKAPSKEYQSQALALHTRMFIQSEEDPSEDGLIRKGSGGSQPHPRGADILFPEPFLGPLR